MILKIQEMSDQKKIILFRADGNSSIGLGHLYRLFALVEIVKSTYEFIFVTRESTSNSVIPSSYPKVIIPQGIILEEEGEWLSANFLSDDYIIIVDGYQFNASYQKKIKEKGYKLLYIDDLAQEYMYADVVINHSGTFNDTDYKKKNYTQLALGSKYALLRPEFLNLASKNRTINKVDTAFVCFGGADPFNLTKKAVQALLKLNQIEKINVVIGKAYSDTSLNELAIKNERVEIFRDISAGKLSKVMSSSNIGIVPCSTILYEICSVKMPVLSGYYVDNQKYIYKELLKKNVIYNGGNFRNYESTDFINKLSAILSEKSYDIFLKNQKTLIDGNSKRRLLGLISQFSLSLRKANEKDLKTVFKWSNDNLVRRNSFNSEPILLKDHKKWYLNKIQNKNTLFLIALVNEEPAGLIRFEMANEKAVIGILVGKKHRGQKLANVILRKSVKVYFSKFKLPIVAYIKENNIISQRSFQNVGFDYNGEKTINGSKSYIYILKNDNEK